MTSPVIHRVSEFDLSFRDWRWPFAEQHRAEIDAHFATKKSGKPELFNGRILLARNPLFTAERFSADYFETDFASFLAWRDWGFPDKDIVNGFGMGALRSSDGAFALGEMADHTEMAGKVYFPSGTPDLRDVRGASLDIADSVAREVEEETGLAPADYRAAPSWDCVVTGFSIAMMRILDVDMPGEALRARIIANLAGQTSPELSGIHLIRSVGDLTPQMPVFVTAFLEAQLD